MQPPSYFLLHLNCAKYYDVKFLYGELIGNL